MLRYTTDRARPGLVALYDNWPGNRAGQFLQPRSRHGARESVIFIHFESGVVTVSPATGLHHHHYHSPHNL